jgi:hypothetical protein
LDISSAYPPDFAFHPDGIRASPDAIEAGSERYPSFFREILGPGRTIAKENRERKQKSQKKAGKMRFLSLRVWKSPLKMRLRTNSLESRNARITPWRGILQLI